MNKIITKHLAILAKSGSGKSFFCGVLLEEILEKKIPVLVIDPHGEYSSLKFPSRDEDILKKFGLEPKGYFKQIQEYSPDIEKNLTLLEKAAIQTAAQEIYQTYQEALTVTSLES